MYASNIDKFGKVHKGKYVKSGKCVFPFSHKRKMVNKCVDTGKGPWCATSVKKRNVVNTWGYCVDDSVIDGAKILQKMRSRNNKSNKIKAKTKTQAALMRKELLELSKPYQDFKANQIVKKKMAKSIKANNLKKVRKSLKKIKK